MTPGTLKDLCRGSFRAFLDVGSFPMHLIPTCISLTPQYNKQMAQFHVGKGQYTAVQFWKTSALGEWSVNPVLLARII